MTCDLVKANFPIIESRWVAAHLPIQFQIESDRWPENRIDDIDSVAEVLEGEGGLALFLLAGTYETYQAGEYVQVTNATIGAYNGIWKIIQADYPDQLLLQVSFLGDATASLQRYYNNYAIKVDVFAGIPNGHPLQSRRPIERKTESPLLYRPRQNNIAYVNISDFVRADLPKIENELCALRVSPTDLATPDTNLWTGFYITYSEVWDVVDVSGDAIQTNTDTFVLGPQLLLNNNFFTGPDGFPSILEIAQDWISGTSPDTPEIPISWNFNSLYNFYEIGVFRVGGPDNIWVGSYTEYAYQSLIPTVAGETYRLIINTNKLAPFTTGTSDFLRIYDLTDGLGASDRELIADFELNISGIEVFAIDFVATHDNMTLGFQFQIFDTYTTRIGVTSLDLRLLTAVPIDPTDPDPSESASIEIFYATNSVQQPQYQYGNSMGEYSAPDTGQVFEGKFLTLFQEPVLFPGWPFDLAIILPDNEPYPANALKWQALDKNRNAITSPATETIPDYSEGIYRFIISDLAYPDAAHYLEVWLENVNGQVSETKTIRIDRRDCRDGVFLTWLNYLGGWDSWLFKGYQDLGVVFEGTQQETKRDIFNLWDNVFIDGATQSDFIQIQSRNQNQARSQFLTDAEVDAIKWIRQSIKVQQIQGEQACAEQTRKTILVDKNSFTIRTTKPGLRTIEFNFRDTYQTLIQTQ